MSKFDEALAKYQEALSEIGGYDAELLKEVAKNLGPSLYKKDAQWFAAAQQSEIDLVKQNFLIKKLGLSESDDLDGGIKAVLDKYNPRNKHRAVVYYLLVKHFGKEAVYS